MVETSLFPYHLKEIKKWKIKKVFCDKAYDSFGIYRKLIEEKIEYVIKPRKTAIMYYSKKNLHPYTLRDVYVREINAYGYEEWRKRHCYGKRWHVEICISAFKRMFGENVISKNYDSIVQEFKIKVWIYNMLRLYSLNNRANRSVLFFVIFIITENYRTN